MYIRVPLSTFLIENVFFDCSIFEEIEAVYEVVFDFFGESYFPCSPVGEPYEVTFNFFAESYLPSRRVATFWNVTIRRWQN